MERINSKKILKYALEGKFSDFSIESCLKELFQNSRRAKAKNVEVELKDNILSYKDDGCGVSNWRAALVLGDSDWDSEIIDTEDPAGFGLFSLYAISDSITITSRGKEVSFTPDKLIEDKYFEQIIDKISNLPKQKGFNIKSILKINIFPHHIDSVRDVAKWFYMLNIKINGSKVNKITPADIEEDSILTLEYEGNKIYIEPQVASYYALWGEVSQPFVLWKGEIIPPPYVSSKWHPEYAFSFPGKITYVIEKNNPLDISLPYRKEIVKNDKYEKLMSFIENQLEAFAQNCANNLKKGVYELECNGDLPESSLIRKCSIKEKIGINYKRREKSNDFMEIEIYQAGCDIPWCNLVIYGEIEIEKLEKALEERYGIKKIGAVKTRNFISDVIEPIQYYMNSYPYDFKRCNEQSIKNIIKGIKILNLHNYFKEDKEKYVITDENISVPFLGYKKGDELVLFAKNLQEAKKYFSEADLVSDVAKILTLYPDEYNSDNFYDRVYDISSIVEKALAKELNIHSKIENHIISAAREVIKSEDKIEKLRQFIKNNILQ